MKFIQLFATSVGAGIFFLASWAIISPNVNLDLNKVDQRQGRVINLRIATRITKKYSLHQKLFRFELDNYDYPFDAYRPSQEYANLSHAIHICDTVKVYFRKWRNDNTVTDVYQIEKSGQILLDYRSYNKNYELLGAFLFLAGLFFLFYGFWKYRNAKNNR